MNAITRDQLFETVTAQISAFAPALKANTDALAAVQGRLAGLEQALASIKTGGGPARKASLGQQIAASAEFKNFIAGGGRGSCRIKAQIEYPSGLSGFPGDSVVPADQQQGIIGLAQQRMTIRGLLSGGTTTSDLVKFVRQEQRDIQARPVAPGDTKPESDLLISIQEAPVRTIAHVLPVPRQSMDDINGLSSWIDSEMRFGLALAEEQQLLSGDGTGENLLGLEAQSTPYDDTIFSVADEQMFDVLLKAVAQMQTTSKIPADGIVVNDLDWKKMQAIKDGQQRYIAGGPFVQSTATLWGLPVIDTASMDQGSFLVGNFRMGAQALERMGPELLISSEHADFFVRNMLMVRCEERVALAVKRPQCLVFGEYPSGT